MPMEFGRMSGTLLASAALATAEPGGTGASGHHGWCCSTRLDCGNSWQAEGFASFSRCADHL